MDDPSPETQTSGTRPAFKRGRLDDVDLDEVMRRRMSLRTRLARAGSLLVLLALAAGLLAHQIASELDQDRIQSLIAAGPVVLVSNVSFGTVTLNGKPLPGSPPLVLPVRTGENAVTFAAPPFLSRSCHLTWGASGLVNGDCPAEGRDRAVTINGRVVVPSAIIAFGLSGGDLPVNLYASARAVAEEALNKIHDGANVPPGQYIATGGYWPDELASELATMPLDAAITFGLYIEQDFTPRSQECDISMCAGPLFVTTASARAAPVWNADLDAFARWEFTGGGLHEVSVLYPLMLHVSNALTYDAFAGWQQPGPLPGGGGPLPFDVSLEASLCSTGSYVLGALTQTRDYIGSVVRDSGRDGCEIELQTVQGRVSQGLFIWRFGVLLAADAIANALLPGLPLASAAKIAAVGG